MVAHLAFGMGMLSFQAVLLDLFFDPETLVYL